MKDHFLKFRMPLVTWEQSFGNRFEHSCLNLKQKLIMDLNFDEHLRAKVTAILDLWKEQIKWEQSHQ